MDEKDSVVAEAVVDVEEVNNVSKETLAGQISLYDLLAELRC